MAVHSVLAKGGNGDLESAVCSHSEKEITELALYALCSAMACRELKQWGAGDLCRNHLHCKLMCRGWWSYTHCRFCTILTGEEIITGYDIHAVCCRHSLCMYFRALTAGPMLGQTEFHLGSLGVYLLVKCWVREKSGPLEVFTWKTKSWYF